MVIRDYAPNKPFDYFNDYNDTLAFLRLTDPDRAIVLENSAIIDRIDDIRRRKAPIEVSLGINRYDLSLQQIFDFVVEHLRKQQKPCEDGDECRYRHDSLMCAAGPFLTDEEAEKWEGKIIGLLAIFATNKQMNLMEELQGAHDLHREVFDFDILNSDLSKIALKYELMPHDPILRK